VNDRSHETIVELLPAYVLGALDPDELGFVEAYLAAHPEAHGEVEELRETLGLLAFAAPRLAPPPGAKAALLERVERLAAPMPVRREPTPLRPPLAEPARFARRGWLAFAAVAAAVVFALVGWNAALQRQIGAAQGQATTLDAQVNTLNSQLSAQADAAALGRLVGDQRFARPLSSAADGAYASSGGPAGYTYLDLQGNVGLLNCYWMPTLAPNQVYQIWLLRADGRRDNGGTFTVDPRGNASVVVRAPATFGTYTSIGVTAEPAPGSTGPTTPRVVWADLN